MLLGQKLAASKASIQTGDDKRDDSKMSLLQQYGKNRSVQYLMRKGLEDQAAQNRKVLMSKPSTAAINMRDHRKVYNYLIHDEQGPFQTKPMPILAHDQQDAARITQMSR